MAAGLLIVRGSFLGISAVTREFLGADTGAEGDLVNLESGELNHAGAGDEILGVAMEAFTSSSTGVEVNVTPGLMIVMDNDNTGTTFAATHVGDAFDITGDTGAQIVDTSTVDTTATGRSGQLRCLAYNPQGIRGDLDSDTSVGLYVIAERQFLF